MIDSSPRASLGAFPVGSLSDRLPVLVVGISLILGIVLPPVSAQDHFSLQPGSVLVTGCIGPSPCDCLGWPVGPVTGTYRLQLLVPPLGPVFDYLVLDVDWVIDTAGGPVAVAGAGTLSVDVAAGTQQVMLDLLVGGVAQVFESLPGASLALGYPGHLEFDVFAMVDSCTYDGFTIVSSLPLFSRGDCNGDGQFNIADPIFVLGYLFSNGPAPGCEDACDANDDGQINIADAIRKLAALFSGGAPPPAPFPGCGPDPTPDAISCGAYPNCP